jgi:hypothetical protein
MPSRTQVVCKALLMAAPILAIHASLSQSVTTHHAVVEWYADLSAARKVEKGTEPERVATRATGRVTAAVDFPHQTITFHVDAKGISGVKKIEVRADNSQGDAAGPAIFTIYDAHDGPFTGSLTRAATGPVFTYVATPILNGRAAIVIASDAYPDGEIVGKIEMHKHYAK